MLGRKTKKNCIHIHFQIMNIKGKMSMTFLLQNSIPYERYIGLINYYRDQG